jgi:transcription initiation factor TFIID subunit 1
LRFSRLFGPGKPSSLPQIWKGVKRRRKKKVHRVRSEHGSSADEAEATHRKHHEWKFDFAPTPPPDQIYDNEVECD